MDTYEARARTRDLGRRALGVIEQFANGSPSNAAAAAELRSMEREARSLLGDAGFPAESTWWALQRASMEADNPDSTMGTEGWRAVTEDLTSALEILESLLSVGSKRDADFRIIG